MYVFNPPRIKNIHQQGISNGTGYLSPHFVLSVWFDSSLWPSFTSRPARTLKFSRLSQHGLMLMSMECLLFGTFSGPFLDHVGTL